MREAIRCLLYVKTSLSTGLAADQQYTIARLLPRVSSVILAEPSPQQGETCGGQNSESQFQCDGVIQYSYGICEILAKWRNLDVAKGVDQLLVVTDSAAGPVGDIDAVLDRMRQRSEPIVFLFEPESRDAPTEDLTLANPEAAGDLACEPAWIELRHNALASGDLWKYIGQCADSTIYPRGWLDIQCLAEAAKAAGIETGTAYSVSRNDFFARSLRSYLDDGIPFVPWQLFTTDPLVLERWAVQTRPAGKYLLEKGYPEEVFWQKVLHSCAPQTWYTNLGLLSILSNSADTNYRQPSSVLRTAVIAHVFYPEMLDYMVRYMRNVPAPVDLFVTTDTAEKKTLLEAQLRGEAHFDRIEVRLVQTNRGRDISAFLIDCADVLADEKYDVVVKLHSKKSEQDPESVSGWFRDHLFENLLHSPDYVSQIYKHLENEPHLGMIFPPVIHMGVPTMGNGWTLNREPALILAKRLNLSIPFDTVTPLSPYGSMFIARRAAIAPLLDARFLPEEFPEAKDYKDGSLAHVLERLFSYVAFNAGYYARCFQVANLAEISTVLLEYKFDQVSHYLYPFASRQVKMLSSDRGVLSGGEIRSLIQRQLSARYPRFGKVALACWLRFAGAERRLHAMLRRARRE